MHNDVHLAVHAHGEHFSYWRELVVTVSEALGPDEEISSREHLVVSEEVELAVAALLKTEHQAEVLLVFSDNL